MRKSPKSLLLHSRIVYAYNWSPNNNICISPRYKKGRNAPNTNKQMLLYLYISASTNEQVQVVNWPNEKERDQVASRLTVVRWCKQQWPMTGKSWPESVSTRSYSGFPTPKRHCPQWRTLIFFYKQPLISNSASACLAGTWFSASSVLSMLLKEIHCTIYNVLYIYYCTICIVLYIVLYIWHRVNHKKVLHKSEEKMHEKI